MKTKAKMIKFSKKKHKKALIIILFDGFSPPKKGIMKNLLIKR
jgi:hypothetical protein